MKIEILISVAFQKLNTVRTHPPTHQTAHTDARIKHTITRVHRGADKSLARPGRKKSTATEDFDVHISYL